MRDRNPSVPQHLPATLGSPWYLNPRHSHPLHLSCSNPPAADRARIPRHVTVSCALGLWRRWACCKRPATQPSGHTRGIVGIRNLTQALAHVVIPKLCTHQLATISHTPAHISWLPHLNAAPSRTVAGLSHARTAARSDPDERVQIPIKALGSQLVVESQRHGRLAPCSRLAKQVNRLQASRRCFECLLPYYA